MMNSISPGSGCGSRLASEMGVSVVPTTAWPCHGIANMTRPSRVCGGLREVDEQTAIVKLTIVVKHTAAQAVAL